MLALTRRIGETIVIGDDIEVTVIAVTGEQIKLGIHAPRNISIHRKEIYLQIQEENKAAAATSDASAKALQELFKKK
jgi:carbon storage regulator